MAKGKATTQSVSATSTPTKRRHTRSRGPVLSSPPPTPASDPEASDDEIGLTPSKTRGRLRDAHLGISKPVTRTYGKRRRVEVVIERPLKALKVHRGSTPQDPDGHSDGGEDGDDPIEDADEIQEAPSAIPKSPTRKSARRGTTERVQDEDEHVLSLETPIKNSSKRKAKEQQQEEERVLNLEIPARKSLKRKASNQQTADERVLSMETPKTKVKSSSKRQTDEEPPRHLETPVKNSSGRRANKCTPKAFVEDEAPPVTPHHTKECTKDPAASLLTPKSPVRLPKVLSSPFIPLLDAQKHAVLQQLYGSHSPHLENEPAVAVKSQLKDLLAGTVLRGEGNSCLLLGPTGSGKLTIMNETLKTVHGSPIVVRLSGHAQPTDRHAMREIARQVTEQGAASSIISGLMDDTEADMEDPSAGQIGLPPSAHLPTLVSALAQLSRPVVVIIDAFDLFTGHARQALLYCLLDAVQACAPERKPLGGDHVEGSSRATFAGGGLAVVGLTTRIDTLTLLEKRVKSRFSHRVLWLPDPRENDSWMAQLTACLNILISDKVEDCNDEAIADWRVLWETSLQHLKFNAECDATLKRAFLINKSPKLLTRILSDAVLRLNPTTPFLTPSLLSESVKAQCCTSRFEFLSSLPYPALSLLVAASHSRASGHDIFTFASLHSILESHIRTSNAMPVTMIGARLGMKAVRRDIVSTTFDRLIRLKIFQEAAAPAGSGCMRQFTRYRCVPTWDEIRIAIEKSGITALNQWFKKGTGSA